MNAPRWRAWLIAGAIFTAGLVAGAAGGGALTLRRLREAVRTPADAPGFADRAAARIADDLVDRLDLAPEESGRVRTTLAHTAGRLKALRVRFTREAVGEIRTAIAELEAELPPGKRSEFRRLVAARFAKLGLPPPAEP